MKNVFLYIILPGLIVGAFIAGTKLAGPSVCGAACEKQIISVTASEFKKLSADKNIKIIDLRRPDEFTSGHIEGAINTDIGNSADFNKFLETSDKNTKYLVYCRSGNRSGQAMKLMEEKGFTNVVNLTGGIIAWQNENFTLVK